MKPGNSDPDETDKDVAEKAESTSAEQAPAETRTAEADDAEPVATEPDKVEAKPAAKKAKPKKSEPATDPTEDEPLMAELEKAPPLPEEPVMPTAAEAARKRSDLPRPKVLRIALYLVGASVLLGLFSSLALFLNKTALISSAKGIKTAKPMSEADIERAVTSLLWLYLVVMVALGAFLALATYKAQDGVRRARMMALIVTVLMMVFHFYFFPTIYGQISGLLAAIAIVMLYLPSTREYFGPRQTTR